MTQLAVLYPGQTAIRNDSYELYEKPTTPKRTLAPTSTKPRPKTSARPKNATGPTEPPETTESTEKPTTTTADPMIALWNKKKVLMFLNCNTTYLPMDLHNVFQHVTVFVIWNSGLVTFDKFVLKDMNLTEINFQDNEIRSFPDDTFAYTLELESINLGGNRIKSLSDKLFLNNLKLKQFLAPRNEIEALPANLFVNNTKLTFVNLNNNRIKYISIDFTKLRSIEKILGLQNTCADFFLTKRFTAKQLNELVKEKCAPPQLTTTTMRGR